MVCKLLFFFLLCLRYNNIHNSFYYNIVLHRLELYLFSHSITEAHLSCFQIFLNTNNAAMNIFLYDASLDSHVWVYFCRLEVELLNKKLSGLNFIFHVFTFLFFFVSFLNSVLAITQPYMQRSSWAIDQLSCLFSKHLLSIYCVTLPSGVFSSFRTSAPFLLQYFFNDSLTMPK